MALSHVRGRGEPLKRTRWRSLLLLALVGGLCGASCTGPVAFTPTPDYPLLETQVAYKLQATLTAKAPPTATPTSTPTSPAASATPKPGASPTPSPAPVPSSAESLLAIVRGVPGQPANLVLVGGVPDKDLVLTRFAEPDSMSDVSWSKDGSWIIFVSAHDFVHSRNNERNVFMMRPDGSQLRMVTGEYVDPTKASGPFVTLAGKVVGGKGTCLVCAQGAANPAVARDDGYFSLAGAPLSARWVRAVCRDNGVTLQGDLDLAPASAPTSLSLTVSPQGRGWTQASMSRDGQIIAGTYYSWTLGQDGKHRQSSEGVLYALDGRALGKLDLPANTTLAGVDWSPVEDRIVGAVTGEKSSMLWLWDATGRSLGALLDIANSERELLTASNPVWSPDGASIAFTLHHQYWWGEQRSKSELMVVSAAGRDARSLVPGDWGIEATNPSWSAEGMSIYYQLALGKGADAKIPASTNIWLVPVADQSTARAVTADGFASLPAASPVGTGRR